MPDECETMKTVRPATIVCESRDARKVYIKKATPRVDKMAQKDDTFEWDYTLPSKGVLASGFGTAFDDFHELIDGSHVNYNEHNLSSFLHLPTLSYIFKQTKMYGQYPGSQTNRQQHHNGKHWCD